MVALTAVNYAGIEKSALLTRVIVAIVLAVLAAVVVIVLGAGDVAGSRLFGDDAGVVGVLQAAGLLFFAFAGYARIATLGEEVRVSGAHDPAGDPDRAGDHAGGLRDRRGGGAGGRWAAPVLRHPAPRSPTPCAQRAFPASNP